MAGRKTYYDMLGVGRDASSVEIASAFRDKLAEMKAKPGVLSEAVAALSDAYQTLASPARRAEYDESIAPVVRPSRVPSPAGSNEAAGSFWTSALKYSVPLVVIAVAFWGWKRHKAPPAPRATTVAVSNVSQFTDPGPGAVPAQQPARGAAPPGSSRNAEQIFAEISPSIVRIIAADSGGRAYQQGSGVVTGSGRVITNCHVVKGAAQVTVMSAGESRSASVDVADEEFDLCSLDVSRLDAPAVTVGTVAGLRTGQRVFAIGAPLGLELTISEGIVSSLREMSQGKVIQTTAPVSPGSSGGGLFDAEGKLVGIVTFQQRAGQNLNFAVPADWIAEMRSRASSSNASDAPSAKVATPSAAAEPTTAQMVVGKWWCFGSLSGRNGEYDYAADGTIRITKSNGSVAAGRYTVSGRRIAYHDSDGPSFAFDIDSISPDRLVQIVGGGHRLACERRT